MTIHEAIVSDARAPVMTLCLLLLTGQMALLFAAFREGRGVRVRLLHLLHLFTGLSLFYLYLLDICWDMNDPDGALLPPPVLAAFRTAPVSMILLGEALSACLLLAAFAAFRHRRDTCPGIQSIKETMDLLPAGIAYGRADGTVVFSNLAIHDLARAVTGRGLSDLNAFRRAAGLDREVQLPLRDGSAVWQLTCSELEVDGQPFTQLTATDITDQAAVTRALEARNKKLRDLQMRLVIYNRQADRLIIAQELLAARMAVHNELGNVLLESRHYLRDPASIDEETLLQALKNTNTYLLREYEQDDTARDPLSDALDMAEAIGVDVAFTGILPAEGPARTILAAAISECASNEVKHAQGNALSAEICTAGDCLTFLLRSNGHAPAGPIRASGGLLSLRTLVERAGGTMTVAHIPAVTLTIRLPR